MGRKRHYTPLRVLLNNRQVGTLSKELGGALSFLYDPAWLAAQNAIPISLALPLRPNAYRGKEVAAVFDNLLPDSDLLRRRVAERVGAHGSDAFNLLSSIGRDCVGALQFLPPDSDPHRIEDDDGGSALRGQPLCDQEIESILNNLASAPLGLDEDRDFRISIAGAQEKTALLFHDGKWLKPHGTTPTTHIFKTTLGRLPNGLDLSDSIENEFYCLRLLAAFGLPVNEVVIGQFGKTKALIVTRFDRRWTKDGRLLRLPQEDCCQALSFPPSLKYQNEGGPRMVDVLKLLQGSDTPAADQKCFLKAQILFWLIAATDGHAKNFSLFLGPQGRFRLTPLYDVMSMQPCLESGQIHPKRVKLAMSVGNNRHYALHTIQGRHFVQTAQSAGLSGALAQQALHEIASEHASAFAAVEAQLPAAFPQQIHTTIMAGFHSRLLRL